MLLDCHELDSGTTIEGDVCVVGAGPAGLAIASSLRNRGLRIVVLERGGGPGKPGKLGHRHVPVTESSDFEPPPHIPERFGGGANEWIVRLPWMRRGVRMVPLSPIDLESRPWVPNSGWPITWDELVRYYHRANELLDLDGWRYDAHEWADPQHPPLELEPFGFTTAMERFPLASVFTSDLWNELTDAEDVTICLHAPVGHLVSSDGGLETVEIDAGSTARLEARASVFVLAGGGLRNPRLLLNADNGRGIGNEHDVVGRYYMDHLRLRSGTITPHTSRRFQRLGLYDIADSPAGPRMGKIRPADSLLRDRGLLHSGAMMLPRPAGDIQETVGSIGTMVRQRSLAGRRPSARGLARLAAHTAMTAPEMIVRQRRIRPRVDAGWARLSANHRLWRSLSVEHQVEQAPDPSNRIKLSDRRDDHGRPLIELEWSWTDIDLVSVAATLESFGSAVASSGLGTFDANHWTDSPELTTPGGAFHPTGGTRMSDDPKRGVVDADSRVHGVRNLFVAGSSVFPTGGYANPTLTLLALAIRVADRIERELCVPVALPTG